MKEGIKPNYDLIDIYIENLHFDIKKDWNNIKNIPYIKNRYGWKNIYYDLLELFKLDLIKYIDPMEIIELFFNL